MRRLLAIAFGKADNIFAISVLPSLSFLSRWVQMENILMRVMILAALILALVAARAAEQVHVCRGVLTDQRSVGVSLGDCDINSLSDADFKRVTKACGEPNGVDEETNQTKCFARVMEGMPPQRSRESWIHETRQ